MSLFTSPEGERPYMVMPTRTRERFACVSVRIAALLEQCFSGIRLPIRRSASFANDVNRASCERDAF